MVDCPFILKKSKFGITITELLIVVTILAILMIVFLAAFKPWTQQAKARDARRKSDLQKLKNPLEDYYNDNNCYPEALPTLVPDYLGEVPKDPDTDEDYSYASDPNCNWYRIYVTLEYTSDEEIVELGCGAGCGPGGDEGTGEDKCTYNYGVCGGGVSLEGCTETGTGAERCSGWVAPDCTPPIDPGHCGTTGCCPGIYKLQCDPPDYWCCPPEE
jgi:Tfp pilus assembly protein PilE